MLLIIGLIDIAAGFLPPINGLSFFDWTLGTICIICYYQLEK